MDLQDSTAIRLLLMMIILVLVTIFFVAAIYFNRHENPLTKQVVIPVDLEDVLGEMDEEDWEVAVEADGKWVNGRLNHLDRIELVTKILEISSRDRTYYHE